MGRVNTIEQERWRVQVWDGARVTHASTFHSEMCAREYYDTIAIPGSSKTLQVRKAGKQRYARVDGENMRGPLYRAWWRDGEATSPGPKDIIYKDMPRGTLVGELPAGAWPMGGSSLDRTDGGDVFERALFRVASGRVIVVERQP